MTMRIHFYRMLTAVTLPFALGTILVSAPGARCQAQAKDQAASGGEPTVAALHEPPAAGAFHDEGAASKPAPSGTAAAPDPEISPAVAKQLATMQAEIEELKALLKSNAELLPASARAMAAGPTLTPPTPAIAIANPAAPVGQAADTTAKPGNASAHGSVCLRRLDVAERQSAQQRRGVGFKVLHAGNPHGRPLH